MLIDSGTYRPGVGLLSDNAPYRFADIREPCQPFYSRRPQAAPRCYLGQASCRRRISCFNDVNITSGAYSYQRYGKYGYSSNHTYVYGYGSKRKQDEHNDKMTPFLCGRR